MKFQSKIGRIGRIGYVLKYLREQGVEAPCVFIMNGVAFNLSNRKRRQLFGKTLFLESF